MSVKTSNGQVSKNGELVLINYEFNADVYKKNGGSWSTLTPTFLVEEQSASTIGYTGSQIRLNGGGTPAYGGAISDNGHFIALSNTLVGQSGGALAGTTGHTGAIFIFEFDTGTTGYGTPTQKLIKPGETIGGTKIEYPSYGETIQFGGPINPGTTDTLLACIIRPQSGHPDAPSNYRLGFNVWEYDGVSWNLIPGFSDFYGDTDNLATTRTEGQFRLNTASKTVFVIYTTFSFADSYSICKSIGYPSGGQVFGEISGEEIVNTEAYIDIAISDDGLVLYIARLNKIVEVWRRDNNDTATQFTLYKTLPIDAGEENNEIPSPGLVTNEDGTKLFTSPAVTETGFYDTVQYYTVPSFGAGGASQHAYISNGSDGTSTQGGVGVNNPNAKSDVKIASGGGYGGSSSTSAAFTNTGSGGAGLFNGSGGTAGSSGFINVRRWNSGI